MFSRLWSGIKGYYKEINPATLTGAIDVIAIEQEDGSYVSTPFHVRFGKGGILRPKEKIVDIYVNKTYVPHIKMKLGEEGEAYFVEEEDLDLERSEEGEKEFPEDTNTVVSDGDLFAMDDLSLPTQEENNNMPKRDLCFSESDVWSMDRPSSPCRSDTEVETGESVHRVPEAEVEWKWGEQPKVRRVSVLDSKEATESRRLKELETSIKSEVPEANDQGRSRNLLREPPPLRRRCKSQGYSSPDSLTEESGYRSDNELKDPFTLGDVRMSLCGGLDNASYKPSLERFLQHLVTFEEFSQDPMTVLKNPDLVVQIRGEFFTWQAAAPQIVSMAAYMTPLSDRCMEKLRRPKSVKTNRRGGMRSWFGWGRRQRDNADTDSDGSRQGPDTPPLCSSVPEPRSSSNIQHPVGNELARQAASRLRHDYFSDTELDTSPPVIRAPLKETRRRMRLTPDEISQLNLKPGRNEIVYSVTTQFQGTTRCSCYIYLWKWTDRLVVSDIDGTITKSDVWGHIYTLMGKDWTQAGVCKLYRMIERNGYKIIYLSSRAIGQATLTRDYLTRIRQDGDLSLPTGPVLLNPRSLFHAFHKEVIERRPEEFKTQCLKDVRSLFPSKYSPLYAGFGNRRSDTTAYVDVGIEFRRCFIVNHRGELKNEMCEVFRSTYTELSEIVDLYFPPVNKLTGAEEFADNYFWGSPIPIVNLPDDRPEFDDLDYGQSHGSW